MPNSLQLVIPEKAEIHFILSSSRLRIKTCLRLDQGMGRRLAELSNLSRKSITIHWKPPRKCRISRSEVRDSQRSNTPRKVVRDKR